MRAWVLTSAKEPQWEEGKMILVVPDEPHPTRPIVAVGNREQLWQEIGTDNVCVFDYWMDIPKLPLPRTLTVTVWTKDLNKVPTMFTLDVSKCTTVQHILERIGDVSGIDGKRAHLCDVYSNRFFKQFKRDEHVVMVSDRDVLHCFETSVGPSGPNIQDEQYDVDVIILFKTRAGVGYLGQDPPLIVSLPVRRTYKEYYDILRARFSRFFPTVPEDCDERLFRIELTDRYQQPVPGMHDLPDDAVITLIQGCALLVVLDVPDTRVGCFNLAAATEFCKI